MTSPGGDRTESASVPVDGARTVDIEIDLGRVEVYSQRLSEVRVEASYGMHGFLVLRDLAGALADFKLTAEGGETIRIRGDAPNGIGLGNLSATYRVYIPSGMTVRLRTGAGSIVVRDYEGDLDMNSGVGSITVTASTGKLEASTGSGSVHVNDFAGPVNAKTSVGRITIQRVTGALQLDSGTGSVQVDDWSGSKLVAETRTGSVGLSTSIPLEGDVLLRTSTGSINLNLPAASSMKVTARTKTGSINAPTFMSIDKNGTSQSALGQSGDGKHVVTLEASMGSIHFNTR